MDRAACRVVFDGTVEMRRVEPLLHQSIDAAESLHGLAAARLELRYALDTARRACAIDCSTPIGRAAARVFIGLLSRSVGPDGFVVTRVRCPWQDAPAGPSMRVLKCA